MRETIVREKILIFNFVSMVLMASLFHGGASGCGGGGTPQVAKALEGIYDCVDGCEGECIFGDTIDISIKNRIDEEKTTRINLIASIDAAQTFFEINESSDGIAAINDEGRIGINFQQVTATGDGLITSLSNVECTGTSSDSGAVDLTCNAEKSTDEDVIQVTCQEVVYQKR